MTIRVEGPRHHVTGPGGARRSRALAAAQAFAIVTLVAAALYGTVMLGAAVSDRHARASAERWKRTLLASLPEPTTLAEVKAALDREKISWSHGRWVPYPPDRPTGSSIWAMRPVSNADFLIRPAQLRLVLHFDAPVNLPQSALVRATADVYDAPPVRPLHRRVRWFAFGLPFLWLLVPAWRGTVAQHRRRHGRCPGCGYDRRGAPRCPECGAESE